MRILRLAALAGLGAIVARKLAARKSSDGLEGAGGGGPSGSSDAPGPSVNPGSQPELAAEPAPVEGAQGDPEDPSRLDPEARVAEEEAAAAAEAGKIGGEVPRDERDMEPEMRAVYEAGGGEAEGFEQSEEMLIRNATHDDGGGKPLDDAFTPEAESDRSTAEYGEADQIESTETDDDEGRAP